MRNRARTARHARLSAGFKFIAKPLTKDEFAELSQIPERQR
ncbi:MAG TPA: hypothetical protein VH397_00585 [Xanthobacteraceae bacterium]